MAPWTGVLCNPRNVHDGRLPRAKIIFVYDWAAHNSWRDLTYGNVMRRAYEGKTWELEQFDKQERERMRVPALVGATIVWQSEDAMYDVEGVLIGRRPPENLLLTGVTATRSITSRVADACKSNRVWLDGLWKEEVQRTVAYTSRRRIPTTCNERSVDALLGHHGGGMILSSLIDTCDSLARILLGAKPIERMAPRYGLEAGAPALIAVRLVGDEVIRTEVRASIVRIMKCLHTMTLNDDWNYKVGMKRQLLCVMTSPQIIERVMEEVRERYEKSEV